MNQKQEPGAGSCLSFRLKSRSQADKSYKEIASPPVTS